MIVETMHCPGHTCCNQFDFIQTSCHRLRFDIKVTVSALSQVCRTSLAQRALAGQALLAAEWHTGQALHRICSHGLSSFNLRTTVAQAAFGSGCQGTHRASTLSPGREYSRHRCLLASEYTRLVPKCKGGCFFAPGKDTLPRTPVGAFCAGRFFTAAFATAGRFFGAALAAAAFFRLEAFFFGEVCSGVLECLEAPLPASASRILSAMLNAPVAPALGVDAKE